MEDLKLDKILEDANKFREKAKAAFEVGETGSFESKQTLYQKAICMHLGALYEQNKAIIELLQRNLSSKIDYDEIERKLMG